MHSPRHLDNAIWHYLQARRAGEPAICISANFAKSEMAMVASERPGWLLGLGAAGFMVVYAVAFGKGRGQERHHEQLRRGSNTIHALSESKEAIFCYIEKTFWLRSSPPTIQ